MSDFTVKIYNSDLEVCEYNISASSESVARMRALTMYNQYASRFTMITKITIAPKKRGLFNEV